MNTRGFVGGVALALAVGTTGCSSNAAEGPPTASADPNVASAVEITDTQVNTAIAKLDGMVEQMMADTGIPGAAVAVVWNGEPVYTKGFGVTDVDTGAEVNADTAFQIASVSKSVSTSVVASVVGDGGVSWDDPVVEHLPDFTLSDPWVTAHTTIGDLFAMRSGLPHQAGDDLEELGYDRMQIIEKFRYLPLSPFRDQSLYTNFGLTAGAEAVARSQGVPWEQLAAQRIYQPLGMTRTTSLYDDFMAQDNRATLHVESDGTWVANGNRKEQAQAPAGQVSTTANDFAKWMIMMLGDGTYEGQQVVDAAALAEAHVPRVASEEQDDPAARTPFYGYGLGVRTDSTGRVRDGFSGAYSQGAAAHFTLLPSEDLGIAVFTNAYPMGAAEGLAYNFLDLVELGQNPVDWADVWGEKFAAALAGGGGAEGEEAALPEQSGVAAAPLADYVGVYQNDYYGPVTVALDGADGLLATAGPAGVEFPLAPYNGNIFGTPDGKGGLVPAAEFTLGQPGGATVEFAALQAPGNSVFTRAAAS